MKKSIIIVIIVAVAAAGVGSCLLWLWALPWFGGDEVTFHLGSRGIRITSQTTGNSSAETTTKKAIPPDLPFYPGAQAVEVNDLSPNLSYWGVAVPRDKVIAWYDQAIPNSPWTLSERRAIGADDNLMVDYALAEDNDFARISISQGWGQYAQGTIMMVVIY